MNKLPCSGCEVKTEGCIDYCARYMEYKKMKEEQNQEVKADAGKLQITLVPRQIIRDIAEVRMFGVRKYHDPENWRKVEKQRYKDALCRHLMAYLDDEKSVDPESGLSHLAHMCCNAAFLCEMQKEDE